MPTRKKKGKKILHQCQKNGLFRSAKHIAIFTPNDGEVETENTIDFLKKRGIVFTCLYWQEKNSSLQRLANTLEKIVSVLMSRLIHFSWEPTKWTLF